MIAVQRYSRPDLRIGRPSLPYFRQRGPLNWSDSFHVYGAVWLSCQLATCSVVYVRTVSKELFKHLLQQPEHSLFLQIIEIIIYATLDSLPQHTNIFVCCGTTWLRRTFSLARATDTSVWRGAPTVISSAAVTVHEVAGERGAMASIRQCLCRMTSKSIGSIMRLFSHQILNVLVSRHKTKKIVRQVSTFIIEMRKNRLP